VNNKLFAAHRGKVAAGRGKISSPLGEHLAWAAAIFACHGEIYEISRAPRQIKLAAPRGK